MLTSLSFLNVAAVFDCTVPAVFDCTVPARKVRPLSRQSSVKCSLCIERLACSGAESLYLRSQVSVYTPSIVTNRQPTRVFPCLLLFDPHWGTVDAKINVPSAEKSGAIKFSLPFQPGAAARIQFYVLRRLPEFLPFLCVLSWLIQLNCLQSSSNKATCNTSTESNICM